jgi:dephospho-CoA kinase
LTGGLGAGKSTALAALERLGAAVLSTDAVVHELYATDPVRAAIRGRLGPAVVAEDGRIDRAAVARRVFADEADRRWLEGLLWPLVGERVAAFRAAAGARVPAPAVVVIETPLLFEAGLEAAYDATIAVVADDELRGGRAGGRGQEAIAERERRQLSQEEKARRATYVVHNSGSLEELEHRLGEVLAQLSG